MSKKVEKEETKNDKIKAYLDRRIVDDDATKQLVFYTGISSYLKEPLNTFLKGAPSIGKGYVTRESLKAFDRNKIKFLGGMSPKAIFHQKGILLDSEGKTINFADKPEKPLKKHYKDNKEGYEKAKKEYFLQTLAWNERLKDSYTYIDWSGKIIVFLEEPSKETMDLLRPFLSHDVNKIEYEFTGKSASGSLLTKRVVIEGFPAFIFCACRSKYVEEIATRCFTTSPSAKKKKIKKALEKITNKYSYPFIWNKPTEEQLEVTKIIEDIPNNFSGIVVIPFDLHMLMPSNIPRDMRDYEHFMQLCSAVALVDKTVEVVRKDEIVYIATMNDVEKVFDIYKKIIEMTRAGLSERELDFYWNVIANPEEQPTASELTEDKTLVQEQWKIKTLVEAYNRTYPDRLAGASMYHIMKNLERASYVNIDKSEKAHKFTPIVIVREANLLNFTFKGFSHLDFENNCKTVLNHYLLKGVIRSKNKIISNLEELFSIVSKNRVFKKMLSNEEINLISENTTGDSLKVDFKRLEASK